MDRKGSHWHCLSAGILSRFLISDTHKWSINPSHVISGDRYSRVVFTSTEGENLWNLNAIKSMCNVDNLRVSQGAV